MQSRVLRRLALAVVLGVGAAVCLASRAEARPSRPNPRVTSRGGFNLFQGAKTVLMNVNRIACDIDNKGQVCTNPLGGGSLEDGTWPKGSPDTYIFNGGLQVAGTVQSATPFKWSGDTVGVYFMDARGDQRNGEGLTNIFSSTNQDDLNNWPDDAVVRDTSLFDASLIGRQTISQQDVWTRYWDGNPNLGANRKHPMGVMVEQRAVAWNFPSGNEDIIYVLFRFVNITAANPAVYTASTSLINAGYTAPQLNEIAAVGAQFASSMNQLYNITIPPNGYTFHNMFADFFQDMDIAGAVSNYSTASLPFAMSFGNESDWFGALWSFPPDIFGAPFAAVTGLEGVKYLKSPINPATGKPFGISLFSNTLNSAGGFPDPVGTSQLYRYMSGTVSPTLGDFACSNPTPAKLHYCFAAQTPQDTRFFMSSGPFDLAPGQSATIVVAIVLAAPVASLPASTTGPRPLPAFSLAPWINQLPGMTPGFPPLPESLATGNNKDTVRNIERVAGWAAYRDANADGIIEQNEVTTVPRSLLNKSLVAQAVFDSKFLLPFAPETPEFYAVPGDGQVTIAWAKSLTEDPIKGGDPYFKVASDVTNALYDPNYRKFDVEGYRIWRGRTQAEMQVIAQFDYAGTVFTDNNGMVWTQDYGNQCAPELGLTLSCPAFPHPVDIISPFVQFKPGDRGLLSSSTFTDTTAASRTVTWIKSDTAVTGGGTGYPSMEDTGVPFAFIDNTVRNGFTYYYAVTAFDINSAASGPTSLQSGLVPKSATPRAPATNVVAPVIVVGEFGGDGTQLDPSGSFPALDAANGTLTGPVPPADSATFQLLASVSEVLPTGSFGIRVDSVSPGFYASAFGAPPTIYMSFFDNTTSYPVTAVMPTDGFSAGVSTMATYGFSKSLVPYDTARARTLGISTAFALANKFPVEFTGTVGVLAATSPSGALAAGRYGAAGTNQGGRFLAHSYWYNEGSTPPADPTINPFPSAAHTNGALTGITSIYEPLAYRLPISGGTANYQVSTNFRGVDAAMSAGWYPGDFVVTWGAGGAITVRDSTHRVNLPFKRSMQTGYGFLDLAAINAAGVVAGDIADGVGAPGMTALAYQHIYTTNPGCTPDWWGITCVPLRNTAVITPLNLNSDGATFVNGFVLLLNGEPFFMVTNTLPAAGTKWHFVSYGGGSMTATCTPALPASGAISFGNQPTDCSGYKYTAPTLRPAFAPGLQFKLQVTQGFSLATAAGDISRIHTVPDPYYVTNSLETTQNDKILRFVNLPSRAIIRIYSASGILLRILTHNSIAGGGEATWDLRNRNNQFVASGVYFYHVETPDGQTKIGRFTVVNFAQ